MFSAIGLYIAVMINGQVHEAVPVIFTSMQACQEYQKLYQGIAIESQCFHGTFKQKP